MRRGRRQPVATRGAERAQAGAPPGLRKFQRNLQVGRSELRPCTLRPFDQAQRVRAEIFREAGTQPFGWIIETIKIKVIQV